MTTGMTKRDEAKERLAQLLGLGDVTELKEAYVDLFNVSSLPRLDVIMDIAEEVAALVSEDLVQINGNGPQKLRAIYEAAQKTKGKFAETVLAIIESNDFEDDHEPFVPVTEETDGSLSQP